MATESILNTDILIRDRAAFDFLDQKSSENLYFVPQGWGTCVNVSPQGWGFCCISKNLHYFLEIDLYPAYLIDKKRSSEIQSINRW